MDARTWKNQFDEPRSWRQRDDVIQAEPPFLILFQQDEKKKHLTLFDISLLNIACVVEALNLLYRAPAN